MYPSEEVYFDIHSEKELQILYIDSLFFHYLKNELKLHRTYRKAFTRHHKNKNFKFILHPTCVDTIDYKWNYRVFGLARERSELDHALSWLSTLGGAFSALGDYFVDCALMAGKISVNQLKLALRLRDPSIAARCKLFLGLSLIQQRRYKLAKTIIFEEFKAAKNAVILDERLVKMCQGIWAKLQYEHSVHKNRKKLKRIKLTVE